MFEKLISDVENAKEEPTVAIDIYKDATINPEYTREVIRNIINVTKQDLYTTIRKSYKHILNDIMQYNDAEYINAFTDSKFLTTFIEVISNVPPLEGDEKLCCNKLAYDYFTLKNNDPYIKKLFSIMSKTTNKHEVQALLGIGIPEDIAINLALSRYSSTNEIINVKRVNFIITTSPIEIMTEQMIVWIYEKLFDRVTPLFVGTMTDRYNDEEEWVTDDIMEIYSTISLAVLTILNNMPSSDIRKVLISYAGDYSMIYKNKPDSIRFSIHAISGDYKRITNVVESLKAENIILP